MCWGFPMWGGWGTSWGMMFFMPLFFVLMMVCAFFILRRVFLFGSYQSKNSSPVNNNELLEEMRTLRQEVEKLRMEVQK